MTTVELESSLQREFMKCPECGADVQTVAAEGVPAQALRAGTCGDVFFMDLASTPRYKPADGLEVS